MRATAPLASPSSTEGNGWVSRSQPRARRPMPAERSDVDQLAEVRHEVLDEAIPAVGDLRADPRDEGEERDRRNHQLTVAIPTDDRRRTAAGSEHAFETRLVQARCAAEILDHLHHAAPDRDVPHELRGPRVDLVVALF